VDYTPRPWSDDAAQLLCAVFNTRPWLAVKRLVLFEGDNHAAIFSDEIHAAEEAHELASEVLSQILWRVGLQPIDLEEGAEIDEVGFEIVDLEHGEEPPED
jgi:hypothetical protein